MAKNPVSHINHDVRLMVEERARARAAFSQRGESIIGWSLKRGFNPAMVHAVLAGNVVCHRGQSHLIAVELGLKPAGRAAA